MSGQQAKQGSVAKMAGCRSGRHPEMGKNLGDDPGLFDGGDDLEFAATMGAMFHVDIEHPFE